MIVSDGDDWRRRRGATQRGFARRRLDGWVPIIIEETDRLIDAMLLGRGGIGDLYPRGRTLVRRIVVRVLFGDGWGLIRASNTQPVLVARYEASSPQRLAAIQGEMEGWLRSQGVEV